MTGKDPWNKGLTKDDPRVMDLATKVSASLKGKPSKTVWTDEMRKAKSDWRIQYHKDNPDAHPNRRLAGNRNNMSYPEKVAFDFLTNNNIAFSHNVRVLTYYPDFVVGNIIIEIDGARWHDKEKDKIRDNALIKEGFVVHRIDSKEHIETKIKEILGLG